VQAVPQPDQVCGNQFVQSVPQPDQVCGNQCGCGTYYQIAIGAIGAAAGLGPRESMWLWLQLLNSNASHSKEAMK
jgi:hypothetical protein